MTTSLLDATPQAVVRMPHPSPWPFLLTVALMVTLYGVLLSSLLLALPGVAASVAATMGWFWPKGETQEI
ncbi:MAG: hypothetical protein ACLGHL_03265 [Actinomycetota bacterium]